jgi:hypothetical protein
LDSWLIEPSKETNNIETLLNKAITTVSSFDMLYEYPDNRGEREIIGSKYPEKFVFDGFQFRAPRMSKAVELKYGLDKGFS